MPTLTGNLKSSANRKRRLGLSAKQRRETRLATILNQGLPPFPDTVLELASVLENPSVNLKRAGELIRMDPSLSAQVLRLCNSPMFGLRYRVVSVEQASVLLGVERLRTIAFTCSLVEYAGVGLPQDRVNVFWQHCFLAALMTERLAKEVRYQEREQAYMAGLLHDIGQIPLWMLAVEESLIYKIFPPPDWPDNIPVEREHFGMDHCKIGKRLGTSWSFTPSLIDVMAHHHEPKEAAHDSKLVTLVATIERFLCAKSQAPAAPGPEPGPTDEQPTLPPIISEVEEAEQRNIALKSASFYEDPESQAVTNFLERQYANLLPLVQLGVKSAVAALV